MGQNELCSCMASETGTKKRSKKHLPDFPDRGLFCVNPSHPIPKAEEKISTAQNLNDRNYHHPPDSPSSTDTAECAGENIAAQSPGQIAFSNDLLLQTMSAT